jgi:hypothetical protein
MDERKRETARRRLLEEIERNARETAHWTGRKAFGAAVMAAVAKVERHHFVKPEHETAA